MGRDRLHSAAGVHQVHECPRCGAGLTLPVVAPESLGTLYPRHYGPYDENLGRVFAVVSRAIRAGQAARMFKRGPLRILRTVGPGRVLDVGCGRGDLAAAFMARGWHATGVEPSAAACRAARVRGVDAREGTLADVPLEPDSFDATIFHHSLEHTVDPFADLRAIHRGLRNGGLLAVTVPNFGSWQRRRYGDRWYHLDLPRHRTHFTREGLSVLLERAGFEVVEVTTSTSAVGLPATIQYVLVGRCLFPSGIGLRLAAGLMTVTQPIARLLDRLGRGGDQLHAVARKVVVSERPERAPADEDRRTSILSS